MRNPKPAPPRTGWLRRAATAVAAAGQDLFDAWGQPAPPMSAREMAERLIEDRVRDRYSLGSILSKVTPQRMAAIFDEADHGLIGSQIELARDIEERDPHVSSLMQTRRLRVTGLTWQIQPGSETEASQLAADECEGWWDPLPRRSLIDRLMDAVLQQIAIDQVIWDTGEMRNGMPYWRPIAFEAVDARRLVYPQIDGQYSPVAPRIMIDWTPAHTQAVAPGKFITHQVSAERGRPGKRAKVRAVAFAWMVAKLALTDFSTLSEQWGLPFLIIEHAPELQRTQVLELLQAIRTSRASRAIGVPIGSKVNVSEDTAHVTSVVQEKLIKCCHDLMSKAILGNVTQTDAAGNNDSVSSPTHQEIGRQIRNADALDVADTINRDLIAPWFSHNRAHFPPDAACPKLAPVLAENPSPEKFGQVVQVAASVGLEVEADEIYSGLGLTKPANVPEVITLQASGGSPIDTFSRLWGGGNNNRGIAAE